MFDLSITMRQFIAESASFWARLPKVKPGDDEHDRLAVERFVREDRAERFYDV